MIQEYKPGRRMGDEIVFVGCGNMGGALAAGYGRRVASAHLVVVDPDARKARGMLPDDGRVTILPAIEAVGDLVPAATVLAVKPQSMGEVLPLVASLPAAAGLVVSIAAGTGVDTIRAALPRARIVRAMPNTPALLGAGVTGLWGGDEVTAEDRRVCEGLFGAVGEVHWVGAEREMDAVTALSGGGPAYVFAFTEALTDAAARLGLPPAQAAALARATVAGAAAMLAVPGADPTALKAAVRSPKGTTDAALRVFEAEGALQTLVATALDAAFRRAGELGRGE